MCQLMIRECRPQSFDCPWLSSELLTLIFANRRPNAGFLAILRARSSVKPASSSKRDDMINHANTASFVRKYCISGKQKFLCPARAQLPHMCEVLVTVDVKGDDGITERRIVCRYDEITATPT